MLVYQEKNRCKKKKNSCHPTIIFNKKREIINLVPPGGAENPPVAFEFITTNRQSITYNINGGQSLNFNIVPLIQPGLVANNGASINENGDIILGITGYWVFNWSLTFNNPFLSEVPTTANPTVLETYAGISQNFLNDRLSKTSTQGLKFIGSPQVNQDILVDQNITVNGYALLFLQSNTIINLKAAVNLIPSYAVTSDIIGSIIYGSVSGFLVI